VNFPAETLQQIAAFGAGVSIAATLISVYTFRRAAKEKLLAAKRLQLQQVLESSDLKVIGRYVDDVVGRFSVQEYVSDSRVAEILDPYIQRLRDFVGTDAEVSRQPAEGSALGRAVERSCPRSPVYRNSSEATGGSVRL
jgi:hypothetical protein